MTILNYFLAPGLGLRHIQVIMLFFGLFLAYGLRVNMSIGIVAMTDNSSNPDFEVKPIYNLNFISCTN